MFYRLHRKSRSYEEGPDINGWARTWDGKIIEVSCPILGRFHGRTVRELMLWADEFNVKWSVRERA